MSFRARMGVLLGDPPKVAVADGKVRYVWARDEFGADVAITRGGPHVLIGGLTGGGKSVCTRAVLMSAATDPDLGLVGFDPKRVELAPFRPRFAAISQTAAGHTQLAGLLVELMDLRYQVLERAGRVEWSLDLNAGPFILVNLAELSGIMAPGIPPGVEDDLPGALKAAKGEAEIRTLRIRLLGQQARAAGIQLLSDTQRPAVETIDGDFRANHGHRLCLYVTNRWVAEMVLGDISPSDPQPWTELSLQWPGLGFLDDGSGALRRVRSTFHTADEAHQVALATAHLGERLGGIGDWIEQAQNWLVDRYVRGLR